MTRPFSSKILASMSCVQSGHSDRVLFGSDYTINDPAGVIARVQQADLDDAAKAKILGGNVGRMLGERGVKR